MDKKQAKKPEVKKKLSKEELLVKYRSTLMVLKMKSKMGQLVQTHQIKELKKEIARLLTADKLIKNK
ncbi:MAG: 50S ribosomal protein L29 [Mollicutes bacterium UO1]